MTKQGWDPAEYQLLDFGRGRKLESFGGKILDRLCPAADGKLPSKAAGWRSDLRLETKHRGEFRLPQVRWNGLRFQLRLTPFGHVGLFPEQWQNWQWMQQFVQSVLPNVPQALNLFGYTGGSTLALSSVGASVTHVDSSQPAVRWARQNAELSGCEGNSIRWIVEDARKYVRREIKRGKQYDIVVLDPPSFGHGTKGDRWDISRDLNILLEDIVQLLKDSSCPALVFSAHSTDPNEKDVAQVLQRLFAPHFARPFLVQQERLKLIDARGRFLDAGFCVRMQLAS